MKKFSLFGQLLGMFWKALCALPDTNKKLCEHQKLSKQNFSFIVNFVWKLVLKLLADVALNFIATHHRLQPSKSVLSGEMKRKVLLRWSIQESIIIHDGEHAITVGETFNKVSTSSISEPWASAPDTIFIKTALSNLKFFQFFLNKQCGQVITTTSDVTSAERHYISIIQEHGTTKGSACSWRQSETMEIDLSSRTRQIARNSTHPVNPRTFQSILRCRNVFYIIVDINVWFNGKRLSNLSIMIRLIRRLSSRRIFGIL